MTLPECLGKLKNDWAGPRTIAPTKRARATAAAMHCCPMFDGGLQFEIHAGGADCTIRIAPSGKIEEVCWYNFKPAKS